MNVNDTTNQSSLQRPQKKPNPTPRHKVLATVAGAVLAESITYPLYAWQLDAQKASTGDRITLAESTVRSIQNPAQTAKAIATTTSFRGVQRTATLLTMAELTKMFGVKPIEYGKQTGAVAAANFLTSPYVGVHNLQRALMGMHKTGPKISGTTMVKAVLRNSSLTVANSVAAVSRNTSAFVGGKVPAAYANNTYGAELKTIFGNNTLCQNIATRSLTGLPFSMTLGYYLDLVTNKHTGLIYDELMVLGPNKMTTTKLNPETPITLGRAIDLANKEVRGAISERRLPQGYWARVLHNNLGIAITMGVMDWGIKYLSRSSSDDGLNP